MDDDFIAVLQCVQVHEGAGVVIRSQAWAVMYAPAIVLMLGFLITFFVNRFNNSEIALRLVYGGIAIWLIALFIEGIRESFYDSSYRLYTISVLFEESFESIGTILLFSFVLFYLIDIRLVLRPKELSA